MERLDIIRGTAAAGNVAFERSSQRGISANLLVARADRGAIRRINFALH
jgi:hypothetical protein